MSTTNFGGPLFIIGNPRSGTSLLRLILTSHSKILVPPECGFIIWLHKKYANWQISDNNEPARLAAFVADLLSSKKFDTWQLSRSVLEGQIASLQPENYGQLCKIVYAAYGESIGKSFDIWGDKNNFHINHLDDLLGIYKQAHFLHIVRDGRDVACSYREVMAAKSNSPYAPKLVTSISDIATEWSNNVKKIDSFISPMPSEAVFTIRYEDLVLNAATTVTKICDWLGVPFETEMLDFYNQNLSKKLEPEITMDWKMRTTLPISGDTVGRHRILLTAVEFEIFMTIAGHELRKFSYV